MSLSPDYYELWDIEVSYTNPGGTTTTVTTPIDWKYELNLQAADEIPSKYSFHGDGQAQGNRARA